MLKMIEVKLEKISDIEKYLFIEKGSRGGISYISKRYAKANNKYMRDYDSNKPSAFISYLDMNSLYGWKMSQYLPYSDFEWLKNVDELDINSVSKKKVIEDIFLKLILNILMNYTIYIMIIHLLQKTWLLIVIYFQNIVKVLLINMI